MKTIKISKDVFIVLQYFIEQYIVDILKNANFLAIHANRVKLMPIDIQLMLSFMNGDKNPYKSDTNDDYLLFIDDTNKEDLNEDLEEESNE